MPILRAKNGPAGWNLSCQKMPHGRGHHGILLSVPEPGRYADVVKGKPPITPVEDQIPGRPKEASAKGFPEGIAQQLMQSR